MRERASRPKRTVFLKRPNQEAQITMSIVLNRYSSMKLKFILYKSASVASRVVNNFKNIKIIWYEITIFSYRSWPKYRSHGKRGFIFKRYIIHQLFSHNDPSEGESELLTQREQFFQKVQIRKRLSRWAFFE